MKRLFFFLLHSNLGDKANDYAILCFRILISVELICVHGLKKLGIGVAVAEVVPNPIGFPDFLNDSIAITANLTAPIFIIFGLGTRLASALVLCVTLTGLLAMHLHDDPMVRDIPFIYSCCFGFLLLVGSGRFSLDRSIRNQIKVT
ncbi:DoxX family protein [Flavobacterium sp.]|uniref:DoxX family protein n=1 Tax=Flavobacterium sp. TaxID=239 RepID=UPI0011F8F528|nr:DoxX family protein [Flavobacterium sp.]RZJ69394.1 MAG: DoxX family protein [Flavobacterium sp.]